MKRFLILLAILSLFAAHVLAASFDELLDNLNTEISRSVEFTSGKGKKTNHEVALAAQLQRELANGNYEGARTSLLQLANSTLTPEAKQIISQLQQELPDYIENKKKEFEA